MAFATAKDLVELSKRPQGVRVVSYREPTRAERDYYGVRHMLSETIYHVNISERKAREILRSNLKATLMRTQSKVNRPYVLTDVTANLDPNQSWIAWEYETGFASEAEYNAVVNYMFRYQPYTTIDREGHGTYAAELTFSPTNADVAAAETSPIFRLYEFFKRHRIRGSRWSPNSVIGTHVNISTPAYRNDAYAVHHSSAVQMLNVALANMAAQHKTELFGRTPYGYAFAQSGGGKRWVEFKLFNSTFDVEVFKRYNKVALKLADALEASVLHCNVARAAPNYYAPVQITNLYRFLSGRDETLLFN